MKVRGLILLAVFGALLIEQLPLDPRLWEGGEHKCCALSESCPMSARPAGGSGAMPSCDMAGMGDREPECTMRALCGAPNSGPELAYWNTALARPALLPTSAWQPSLAPEESLLPLASELPAAPGKSPPSPPPRWLSS